MQQKAETASVSVVTASEIRAASVLLALDIIMLVADTLMFVRTLRGARSEKRLRE